MFDKKKLNFWRLAIIFSGLTAITLASLWLSPQGTKATMMNESMANMASMHLTNVSIYDLVGGQDTDKNTSNSGTATNSNTDSHAGHHDTGEAEIVQLGIITTIIIFALLPILICATIILSITWIK